jgi:hypothetical protein
VLCKLHSLAQRALPSCCRHGFTLPWYNVLDSMARTQAELEEIAAGAEAGGAKGRAALRSPRALDLEALTTRHKQHIVRMEQVQPHMADLSAPAGSSC